MNLYEALAEVKSLKEKLEQFSELRKESNSHEEGTEPEFGFDDLTDQLDKTFDRLTRLKLAIQAVNMANSVKVEGEEQPLARAILELSSARAKMGYVAAMLQSERRGLLSLDRESEGPKQVLQKSKAELLKLQDVYRKRKNALDSAIQEANTRLAVPV